MVENTLYLKIQHILIGNISALRSLLRDSIDLEQGILELLPHVFFVGLETYNLWLSVAVDNIEYSFNGEISLDIEI